MLAPSQVLTSKKTSARNGCAIAVSSRTADLLFATLAGATVLIFWPALRALAQFSFRSDIYSYIPLIPLITLFLIFDARRRIFLGSKPDLRLGAVFVALAILMLYGSAWLNGLSGPDRISWQTLGLTCLWITAFWLCYGKNALNKALFPLFFLFFMVPFPGGALRGVIAFLQSGSAYSSEAILRVLGVPVLRSGMVLSVLGLDLEVGPQCSGIRSSIVLLIVVIVGSYLFFRSRWHRLVLITAVVPVVIIKNAVRIVSLALLSVYVDPGFLTGSLHHRGGAVFFVIGLLMFIPISVLLRHAERRMSSTAAPSRSHS
jgi:exosortase